MKEKVIEFLKQYTRGMTDCSIMYKPYEHDNFVESISFASAVEKFIKDYEEMKHFLEFYRKEDLAFDATCRIWKKH